MRANVITATLAIGTIALASNSLAQKVGSRPSLNPSDEAAGWRILFDGTDTSAFRGYKQKQFPAQGWSIENGMLKVSKGGGDIITVDQFGDFELEFEFKVSEKGNSGVMYRVAEKHDATWQTGPEYQILDDAGYEKKPGDMQSTGAIYDLVAPSDAKPMRPAGGFNQGRIRILNNVLTHWLNGVKVAEAVLGSEDWKKRVAASKFNAFEGFGAQPRGHIAFQDHGNDIWFRDIRVRELDKPAPGELALFDGKSLNGWKFVTGDGSDGSKSWSVRDGVLVCSGQPAGFIKTEKEYKSFVLRLEWRWSPESKATGNSGVLVRVDASPKVWPKSFEAQLQAGCAGDIWLIEGFAAKTTAARVEGRRTKRTGGSEREPGEWNDYEIIVDGAKVTLKVNGDVVNTASEVAVVAGAIALQSEGTEIHFRNIRLSPIK